MTELYDIMPFDYQITESASGRLRVEGVFQRSDTPNANKRVYPRSLWEKELVQERVTNMLESKAMFGELDHPADGKTMLKRVSHVITGLKLEDDGTVTGAAEILETPNGQILKTLFESGTQVGISSRGSGSVQNGVVQEDFKLGTFDFVARPSTPGALPRPAGGLGKATRTEDAEDVEVLKVIDDDEGGTVTLDEPELFAEFMAKLDSELLESVAEGDLNSVAKDVIGLHNYIMENEVTPELIEEASGVVIQLHNTLQNMAAYNPENADVIADLLEKVEQSRGALIYKAPQENIKEEPMNLEFIKDRLNSQRVDEEAQAAAEIDDLRSQLDELSDEELVEVALEVGAISEEDLYEDDEQGEEIDVQALYDYAVELEQTLSEASEVIEQLSGALEEADVESLTLKYEAALGIIQETVAQYQLLQEAVGGEDKANELMESHLSQLEGSDEEPVEENTDDDGSKLVEEVLNEDGDNSGEDMTSHLRLFEGAKNRLNLTN